MKERICIVKLLLLIISIPLLLMSGCESNNNNDSVTRGSITITPQLEYAETTLSNTNETEVIQVSQTTGNVVLYLLQNDTIVSSANAQSSLTFSNLSPGTYSAQLKVAENIATTSTDIQISASTQTTVALKLGAFGIMPPSLETTLTTPPLAYPNPTTLAQETTVHYTLNKSEGIKAIIYDSTGKALKIRYLSGKTGLNQLPIPTASFPTFTTGIYYLTLNIPNVDSTAYELMGFVSIKIE